ncbi:outer membrane porin, OprD family [Sulfurimonas aquatica]|uniref:Outer membrane porin, OprD family n=1 Tax=Sulfurimonas aquatica TaxID=2672570 RepID=A0A975GDW5_9BACT|nr:OprD family outer membrane porin [Sulfurimonas aquatica]QSZ42788.1 outer membrane porin, OprD family [Sulfurimonas aquatica]
MKYIIYALLLFSSTLLAATQAQNISELFDKANVNAKIKYYYIQTDKEKTNLPSTSAYANSVGGQFNMQTATLNGFSASTTFMTTNPFLLSPNVDTSIIAKDNGALGGDATEGFSTLGELYISYKNANINIDAGRKVIKSPLMNAKDVRMLPSAVSGIFASYTKNKNLKIEVVAINKFKQRTSNRFMGIIEHALGANRDAITESKNDYLAQVGVIYNRDDFNFRVYDDYANHFMNSIYLDSTLDMKIADNKLTLGAQYIRQDSIGNADKNLKNTGSLTGGKIIVVNAVAFKAELAIKSAKIGIDYSKVISNDNAHDSLVLPWDGTPLFTNMITSNNLFQSIYGNALKADSVYIGGTQGVKIFYNQKYDSFGFKGLSTTLAYLNSSNSRFFKDQNDYNAVIAYKHSQNFSIALKAILTYNDTLASELGSISQTDKLTQYRAIANYQF